MCKSISTNLSISLCLSIYLFGSGPFLFFVCVVEVTLHLTHRQQTVSLFCCSLCLQYTKLNELQTLRFRVYALTARTGPGEDP